MKKITSFLFLLSLLITACNAPTTQRAEAQSTPALVATEAPVSPQSALASETEALPLSIDAPLVDGPSILSINMVDIVNGWGITETQIVRTNDGGVTWYNVTPQGITETGYSVSSHFFDSTQAWLQFADPNNYPNGGTMYHTSDGGLTWASNATPFSSGDISFVDSTNGWVMADLGVGAGSMAVSVFQTNDAGVSWERTYTNDPNLDGEGDTLPLGGLKYSITPINMQTAWISGVVYAPGTVYLFRTDDSGRSWLPVALPISAEAQDGELMVEQMKFSSSTQGTLILRSTSAKIRTVIYQTEDGGNTWTLADANVPGTGFADIVSAQEIVFYATDQFYVTKDAAATFGIVPPDVVFGESMLAMDFASASVGWVITVDPSNHRKLFRTEDGGATWFAIIP